MNFKFLHRYGSPKYFYEFAGKLIPWLTVAFLITTLIGLYLGLFRAPPDYQQGESYRIMFVHVPAAWMSMFIYMLMAVSGAMAGLAGEDRGSHSREQRTHRRIVYLPCAGNRLDLGQTDVGNLVGLGCPPDIRVDSAVFIPGCDRAI